MLEKFTVSEEDRETVINYSPYHAGEWCELYTTDRTIMRRYEKFAEQHPDYCKLLKEDKYSMTFSVHPRCVLHPHAPRKVSFTEEQLKAMTERLQNARNK